MKFSFIVPTLNRPIQLNECVNSLLNQDYKNFEIIIIDQSDNNDSRLVLENINTDIPITYKNVNYKGLSKARNDALGEVKGEYICLVDDDAIYMNDYLTNAHDYLMKNPGKFILSGIIIGKETGENFVEYEVAKDKETLKMWKILKICQSAGLIVPLNLLKLSNGFDTDFGVGAKYGSAEETDVLIKSKRDGYNVIHLKKMVLLHPKTMPIYDESYYTKIYGYAKGSGALIKKHMVYNKQINLFSKMLRLSIGQLIKMKLSTDKNIRKEYKVKLNGFFHGFKEYKKSEMSKLKMKSKLFS